MGTRSETAFIAEDGTVLGVMSCQWDGGPGMAWGNELSSVLCLEGREAKAPDGRLTTLFSRRRCGDISRPERSAEEDALDCIRLLKALSPCGDRRLADPAPWKLGKGGKSAADRAAKRMAAMKADSFFAPEWRYAVLLPDNGPAQMLAMSEGKLAFRGTAEEFRAQYDLGPARTLEELWIAAAEVAAPLQAVPAGMLCPEVCRAAVRRNPMEIEFVPAPLLSPEICRECAAGCFSSSSGMEEDRLEEAAAAVMELLQERGASPEAVGAADAAFAEGFGEKIWRKMQADWGMPAPRQ